MDRRDFGGWGANLSDDDFACALAALGSLHGIPAPDYDRFDPSLDLVKNLERSVQTSKLVRVTFWLPESLLWIRNDKNDARKYVDYWKDFTQRNANLRLRVDFTVFWWRNEYGTQFMGTRCWLMDQLSRPSVNVSGVYFQADEPDAPITWKLPLRFGWIDDHASRNMKRQMDTMRKEHPTISRLWSFVKLTRDQVECDVLLMPQSLSSACARLLELRFRIEADLVIVLGSCDEPMAQRGQLASLLRHTVECSGVALSPVEESLRAFWIHSLVREFSHNNWIDQALSRAAKVTGAKSGKTTQSGPILIASERFVENSRLQAHLQNLVSRMEDSRMRDKTIVLSENSACVRRLEMAAGTTTLNDLRAKLTAEGLDYAFYNFESDGASEIVDLDQKLSQVELSLNPDKDDIHAKPRFIQSRVQPLQGDKKSEPSLPYFISGAAHEVDVRVGHVDENWQISLEREFPIELLSDDLDEYRLDVAFVHLPTREDKDVPEELTQSQSDQILLPRRGNSTSCRFLLFVPENAIEVRARIVVSFRQRILQTAILKGSVNSSEEGVIELVPEFAIELQPFLLVQRRPFDVALVLNHTEDDRPGITAITREGVSFNIAKDLGDLTKWFDDKLTEIAYERTDYAAGLYSPKSVELLRILARHGSMLRFALKKALGRDPREFGERIQVLAANPDARHCLELVYDWESPNDDAPICEHAIEALRTGQCDGRCPIDVQKRQVVCPLGFWATNKVLERHANERPNSGRDLEFRQGRLPDQGLQVFDNALAAGSQKVDQAVPMGMQQIVHELVTAIPSLQPNECLQDEWNSWRDTILEKPVSLLVITCHTEKIQGGILQQMEIGNASWLSVDHITKDYVKHSDDSQPLLLLLGCETGAPEVSVLSLVSKFNDVGAKIVVSTTSSLHATHAVPIAIAFVKELHSLCSQRTSSLGEVMRNLRRQALADGLPAILCLTAFGDADFVLTKVKKSRGTVATVPDDRV